MANLPQARQFDIIVQEFEKETLIYDLKTDKAFCLNETSAIVWQLSDGKHSIGQLSLILSQKLNKPVTEDLVRLALDQFKRDGLLENSNEFEIDFGGLNRRELIKKIGLASMVALPVISTIIAPTAAMAASRSCVNPGGAPANTHLGGAGGSGLCTTPGLADATCTSVRGNLCCSGKATAAGGCFQSAPGPNAGTFSVDCYCA